MVILNWCGWIFSFVLSVYMMLDIMFCVVVDIVYVLPIGDVIRPSSTGYVLWLLMYVGCCLYLLSWSW